MLWHSGGTAFTHLFYPDCSPKSHTPPPYPSSSPSPSTIILGFAGRNVPQPQQAPSLCIRTPVVPAPLSLSLCLCLCLSVSLCGASTLISLSLSYCHCHSHSHSHSHSYPFSPSNSRSHPVANLRNASLYPLPCCTLLCYSNALRISTFCLRLACSFSLAYSERP